MLFAILACINGKGGHGVKILLVDDDVGSLRGMQLALIMLKQDCDAYSDSVEAVANYPGHGYDLVITDICMPVLNGFALAEQIRSLAANTKIVFISGYAAEMMEKREAGEDEIFLQKPVDFCQLKEIIDNVIFESELEKENNHGV